MISSVSRIANNLGQEQRASGLQSNLSWRVIGITLVVLLLGQGCSHDSPDPSDPTINPAPSPGAGDNPPPTPDNGPAQVSYYKDVAPLLSKNCVMCHQPGGMAPFALDTYTEAARFANAIRDSTATHRMPPFLPDVNASCEALREVRVLTEDEIKLLATWVEQGIAEGTPPPTPPSTPTLPVLPQEDARLVLAEAYTPVGSTEYPQDDYRCFVVDPGITSDQFLTAYQVLPGNQAMVHHVIAYALNTDAAEAAALAADQTDPTLGYACFGGSQVDVGDAPMVGGWAPGVPITQFPAGTGVRLAASRKMVLQIHYNLTTVQGADQTAVALQFADEAVTEANILPLAAPDMILPPGQAVTTIEANSPVIPIPYEIHGVFPHMHTLGTTLTVEKRGAADASQCLVTIPRWDFNWQEFFFFANPIPMSASDTARLTCSYDTTSRTSPVQWGEGTQDEMCLNFFYVTGLAPLL